MSFRKNPLSSCVGTKANVIKITHSENLQSYEKAGGLAQAALSEQHVEVSEEICIYSKVASECHLCS